MVKCLNIFILKFRIFGMYVNCIKVIKKFLVYIDIMYYFLCNCLISK